MKQKNYTGRTWTTLKNIISKRALKMQWKEKDHWWEIYAVERDITYKCILPKYLSAQAGDIKVKNITTVQTNEEDFIDNFKDVTNIAVVITEEEGDQSIVDKYFEHDSVPKQGGTEVAIYDVPAGETWSIQGFGGSSNNNSCEVQLSATLDGGTTWGHPWDSEADKIRAIHLDKGVVGNMQFANPLKFTGDNGNVKIRLSLKNYNNTITAEIDGWFNGYKES